ncbi:dentin sialophosphoprotein-like [Ptychodera flava]|uniref:dentin sialophosphoprotein-like n=1 Tax=Ptychodera flava TaxID=63121 RepID=UPI00396A2290
MDTEDSMELDGRHSDHNGETQHRKDETMSSITESMQTTEGANLTEERNATADDATQVPGDGPELQDDNTETTHGDHHGDESVRSQIKDSEEDQSDLNDVTAAETRTSRNSDQEQDTATSALQKTEANDEWTEPDKGVIEPAKDQTTSDEQTTFNEQTTSDKARAKATEQQIESDDGKTKLKDDFEILVRPSDFTFEQSHTEQTLEPGKPDTEENQENVENEKEQEISKESPQSKKDDETGPCDTSNVSQQIEEGRRRDSQSETVPEDKNRQEPHEEISSKKDVNQDKRKDVTAESDVTVKGGSESGSSTCAKSAEQCESDSDENESSAQPEDGAKVTDKLIKREHSTRNSGSVVKGVEDRIFAEDEPPEMLNVLLMNCDRLVDLQKIREDLFANVNEDCLQAKTEYFRQDDMKKRAKELRDRAKLNADQVHLAILVVHADESRLSINEKDAGIGYEQIYSALLELSGGCVIVVIASDTNAGDLQDELISNWAHFKIGSQFQRPYLAGPESYVFSWNEHPEQCHKKILKKYLEYKNRLPPNLFPSNRRRKVLEDPEVRESDPSDDVCCCLLLCFRRPRYSQMEATKKRKDEYHSSYKRVETAT